MFSARTPLCYTPQRVLVCGVTGVGKSTLAKTLARMWQLPYTELDALHHGPNWTERATFRQDVLELARSKTWVTEWQYWGKGQRDLLGHRADTLIWLDFPRRIARGRLLRRTVRRRLKREVLWNGNVEPALHVFFTKPEQSILRWEMKTHDAWPPRMPGIVQDFPQLTIIRLTHPKEVRCWLAGPAREVVR